MDENKGYIWWIGNLIQNIVRIGLPMFTFMSGVLILNGKDEPLSKFYWKRFVKIVMPLYIYSFIYLFVYRYEYRIEAFKIKNILIGLRDITSGPVYFHLWYVYMILGVYLCAPFIRKMCQNLNDKDCRNLYYLIFFISFIQYLLPSFEINIGINTIIFIDWNLIFILGYLNTRQNVIKNEKFTYFIGIISFIISLFANKYLQINNLYSMSVFMMFEVVAIFKFCVNHKEIICSKKIVNEIIIFISKYSWQIYLIHGFVLNKVSEKLVFITNEFMYFIIWSILVFIISLILAIIIHNLIIKNTEKILEYIKNYIVKKIRGCYS
jgi:surface polysaccharide O-acyltransferase-like enzyme